MDRESCIPRKGRVTNESWKTCKSAALKFVINIIRLCKIQIPIVSNSISIISGICCWILIVGWLAGGSPRLLSPARFAHLLGTCRKILLSCICGFPIPLCGQFRIPQLEIAQILSPVCTQNTKCSNQFQAVDCCVWFAWQLRCLKGWELTKLVYESRVPDFVPLRFSLNLQLGSDTEALAIPVLSLSQPHTQPFDNRRQ